MINKELVQGKMSDVGSYFRELEPILKEDARQIIADHLKLRTVERLFQLIVDTAIDINTHIIAESGFVVPEDYQSTFTILAENKVMPTEFALKIAPSVGLRNLIVHKYGRVDIKKMVEDVKSEVGQYKDYLKCMDKFLNART